MRPWLNSILVAVILCALLAVLPFVFGARGDPHLGNWPAVIAAAIVLGCVGGSALCGFAWDWRCARKEGKMAAARGSSALVAFLCCCGLFMLAVRIVVGFWVWQASWALMVFPVVIGGASVAATQIKRKPNRPPLPAPGKCPLPTNRPPPGTADL